MSDQITEQKRALLLALQEQSLLGGGQDKIDRQHSVIPGTASIGSI